jgi:Flp pilus assembly protein TadG
MIAVPRPQRRRGNVALEMLLVLPVVLTVVLAMVEYGLMMSAQEHLLAASREGGRVAALGGTPQDVTNAVQRHLGAGPLSQAEIDMTLTDSSGNPVPSGEPVTVWVSLPATAAVPNLLRFIGFDIAQETLVARTVMRK